MFETGLISGPIVVIRVPEHGADRIRLALQEMARQEAGGPFQKDWEALSEWVTQEMSLYRRRRDRVA